MPAAREAAFTAIAAQLAAQLPGVTVERNRRAIISPDEALPIDRPVDVLQCRC
jgi:hypothetical protein